MDPSTQPAQIEPTPSLNESSDSSFDEPQTNAFEPELNGKTGSKRIPHPALKTDEAVQLLKKVFADVVPLAKSPAVSEEGTSTSSESLSDDDPWVVIEQGSTESDITISQRQKELYYSKGTTVINCSPQHLYNMVTDIKFQHALDPNQKSAKVILRSGTEEIPVDVVHLVTHRIYTFGERDIVLMTTQQQMKQDGIDYFITANKSIDWTEDIEPCGIRMSAKGDGFVIRSHPKDPKKCIATYVTQSKLNGWVPNFVMKAISGEIPRERLNFYKNALKKHPKIVAKYDPDYCSKN